LALTALGTNAATCGIAPDGAAALAELLLGDAAGVPLELLELLEHPAATSVAATAAVSVPAAILPGRRPVGGTV
jgi:hypothetical protein